MSLTKLSLSGNNVIIPGHGELISEIPAEDGKNDSLIYSVEALSNAAEGEGH
jgi:hypothetical protein